MRTPTAVVMLLGILAAQAAAQAPTAPAARPQPQPQAVPASQVAPAVVAPTRTPPPPAPAARTANGTRAAAAAEPVRPVSHAGTPVDSARPRAAAALTMPANAVAQCNDDTFIIAPNDASACSAHRGVLVRFPSRAAPQPASHSALPISSQATMRAAAAPTLATAPPGSTMQCKDGTFLSGPASAGRCDRNGGLAAILPAPRQAPTPPAQVRRP